MRFLSLGSCSEVSASCHYLAVGRNGLVLDAGADPNKEGPPSLPQYHLIRNRVLGHALITHAHHDHIGGLPSLVQQFPHTQLHLTEATGMLSDFMLMASARLQERKFREGSSAYPSLFDTDDVEETLSLFSTHDCEQPFPLSGEPLISAEFFDAGHVLGSAGVLLQFEENGHTRKVFYTSDTNLQSQAIIPGGRYPTPPIDVLIMESTLGADPKAEKVTRKREEQRFCEALQAVIEREGCALVPVFMLGRAQEVLAVIDRFKRMGQLPQDLPVYTAGGMREVSRIYDHMRNDTPRIDSDFQVNQVRQRIFRAKRAKIARALRKPAIFVLASGMLFERTLSNRLAQIFIEEEKHAILLVGYCKDDSPGGRLLHAWEQDLEGVVLDREVGMQPIACQIDRFRFSGHSNRRDLVGLAGHLRPQKIILVHGEDAARTWIADTIQRTHPETSVILPAVGQSIDL